MAKLLLSGLDTVGKPSVNLGQLSVSETSNFHSGICLHVLQAFQANTSMVYDSITHLAVCVETFELFWWSEMSQDVNYPNTRSIIRHLQTEHVFLFTKSIGGE